MTQTTYPIRLFGGRNLGVTYDSVAGTVSILNTSLALSSISSSLQTLWANAVATSTVPSKPVFGGDNIAQAVGAILDATPAWRTSVQAALAGYAAMNPLNDPEQFIH
jgi:hypothetical protein